MKNTLITTIIIALLVGGVGFFGGMQYQKSKRANNFQAGKIGFVNGANNQQGGVSRQGNAIGGRPVSGEITSVDNGTITVKTQDGSSKIIIYSASTKINKTTEGASSDLKTGEQVMVIGTEGASGTVTAQNISIGGGMLRNALPTGGQ